MNRSSLPPLTAEQVLIDALPQWKDRFLSDASALVISPGRAQVSDTIRQLVSPQSVAAWYLDLYEASSVSADSDEELQVVCGPDLPESEYALIAFAVLKRGEAELTRDLLQQAHERLADRGWLVVAVDNPKDHWVHDQLQSMFGKVTCEREPNGCAYLVRKSGKLRKKRDFAASFQFRDDGRTIELCTRPGVFSHRRLDGGAKQLLLSCDIGTSDSVLDMGCGSGAVALASAFKTQGKVYAVDSNARAIRCVAEGAERNAVENVLPIWNADGMLGIDEPVDIALANPPYFGDHRISQHFVDSAVRVLRIGGALLVVTKQPNWFESYFDALQFEDIESYIAGKYFVVCGRRGAATIVPE